jgi:hypothetical protein
MFSNLRYAPPTSVDWPTQKSNDEHGTCQLPTTPRTVNMNDGCTE